MTTADGKVILDIQNQLSNGFLPAVKKVSHTGNELLKAYSAVQRASEAYRTAILGLAQSGKHARPDTAEHARKLFEFSKTYKEMIHEHEKNVSKFAELIMRTSKFSNEEKDKLKELSAKFHKDEKVAKKQGPQSLEAFYKHEISKFDRQQSQRYKFFAERYTVILNSFFEFAEFALTLKEDEMALENNVAPPVVAQVEEEKVIAVAVVENEDAAPAETEINEMGEPEYQDEMTTTDAVGVQNSDMLAAIVAVPAAEYKEEEVKMIEQHHEEKRETPILRSNTIGSGSSEVSSIEGIHTRTNTVEGPNTVELISEMKRISVTAVQTDRLKEMTIEMQPIIEERTFVRRVSATPQLQYSSPQQRYQYSNTQASPYESTDPSLHYVNVPPVQYNNAPLVAHQNDFSHTRDSSTQPIHYSNFATSNAQISSPSHLPRVDERNFYANLPERRPAIIERLSPKPQVVVTKPAPVVSNGGVHVIPHRFNPSDYGKFLLINEDFNATGKDQLTVNKGDKVVLIKSGSRGWLFIRDVSTSRTGWIPAPFASAF